MGANPIQRSFCTTREAAQMLGISLRTAQLWVEAGMLDAWKTEGGHRRIKRESIERLLANPDSRAPESPALPLDTAAAAREPFRILVVEDKEELIKLYQLNLRQWPLKPKLITASDGFQALIKLSIEKPDLLVADLFMPDFDGFRMLQSIRKVPDFDDMAIVVVSGLPAEEIAARGGVPAGIPVFTKPIPFGDLQRLANELAAKKLQQGA